MFIILVFHTNIINLKLSAKPLNIPDNVVMTVVCVDQIHQVE